MKRFMGAPYRSGAGRAQSNPGIYGSLKMESNQVLGGYWIC